MMRRGQHETSGDDDHNQQRVNHHQKSRRRRSGGAQRSSSKKNDKMITFPGPLTTAATPHPHSDDDAARHVVVNVQRLQPQDVFTDDDDVSSTQQPPAVNGQQHSERSGDDARSDRTGSSTAGGSSHRHLRGSQHHNTHHLHHHQNNSTRRRRREQEEMVESLRGDSFLRTNIGPMFGPLHQGSVAAVLRRPSHHHDDNTVVFRNGKLNVMRSRWILCYAHATIEDEFYVFAQSHRGGAIASCFVAAALIFLGNVVYAITTELTSLAYSLYATSIAGFLAAGFGMRWLDVALKALRVEYGLGDPLDTAEGYCQSCISSTNKNEGGTGTSISSRAMDPRQTHVHPQHVRPPPVSSDLGNHVGGGLRGFQNFLPLLVRDDVAPQKGITAAATTPAAAATGALPPPQQVSTSSTTEDNNNNIVVMNGNKKQSTLHCWRHAFRINAAAHEIFAMVGIISCFVYSLGNISGRVCDEQKYGVQNTLRVCNGVVQSDATYLFAMVAASFLMPVRFFLFAPLYIILSVAYFGYKKATFIVPITETAFWSSIVVMGTELVVCIIVRYMKETSTRNEYEVYLQLHLKMLEAGHIRRLTETMVSAHVPLKAARTMLLQLQQTNNVPLRPSVAGSGAATDASHSAGGLFSWNSKRAVICTLSIGGFSQWASLRSSLDAVELLQGLFQRFDQLREQAAPLSVVQQQQQQQHHVTGNNNAGGGGGGVGRSAPPPPPIPPPAKYHSFGDTFTAMYLDCRDDKDLVAAVQSIAGFAVRALRGGQDLLGQEVAAKRFMTAEIFGRDDHERNQLQQRQASQAPVTPRAAEPASLVFQCHSLRTICHVDVGSCGGAFCHLSKTICPIGPLAALTSTALHWLQGNLMAHSAAVGDVLFARGGRGGSDHNDGAGGGARRGPTTTANGRVASMGALVCSSKFLSILLRSNDVAMPSLAASMSRSVEGGPNLQQRQPFLLLDADHRADPRTINVTTLRNAISELETQQNWMNIVRQQQAIAHQRSSNAANFLYGGGAAATGGGGSGSHRSGYLGSTSDGGVGSNPLIPPILQLPPDPTASNEESPPLIPFRLPEGPITATPIQYHATLSNRILLAIHPFDTAALTPTVAVRDVNNASSRPSMVTTMTTVATHVVSTTSAPGEPSVSTNSQAHTPHDAINFGNSFPQFSSTEARSPIARSPRDDGSGGGGAGGVIGAVVEISGSSAVGEHHRGVSASIWNPLPQQPSRLSLHPPPPQQQQQRSPTTAVNTIASDANTILRISTDEGEGSSRRDDGIFLSSSGQQHSSSPNAAGKQQTANTTHRTEQQQRVGNHLPAPFSTVHDGENDQQHEEEEAEEDEGDDVHNEPEDPLVSATKRVSLSLVGRFPPWNFLYRFDDPLTEEAYLHNYQSVLNPRELVISKLFCVASFIALIGVCGLDGDLSFTPITDYPLPWIVFGLIVCVISSVVAFFTDLRGAPINRFVHVALSISFQTLYIVAIAVASGRPHTDSDGVSQLGDSQLLWLYVMLNWAVNRPTATHPIIMVIRDTIVCSFFVFRTVYWFNVPGAPRMLYYYLYAAYIFVVLTMRVLGDAMRRYHFATGRLVEYMREELQNDYARLYKSLDLMVPSGVAGRLTQKAKRANTRKLRLGWAGGATMTGAAAEDVDEDGSMRPLRIYGLLSNSFATSVQDTAFLVIEMHPPEQQTPTASTVGVSQHHHRSQGSRDACAAAAVDHFKTLDAIQSTLCAPGKRYHRRIECVKATATRSFWCALSCSSVEKDDDGEDTCGAEVNNNNGAAAEAADGNEAPRSSQEDGTPTPRPHNATAQHQPQHRTLNNSGGSVSRNRALLRFALKCVGLISPHTKVRMFLHCGPVVGAVAGGRAVSFEFYGGPSQLALDCTDHVEWNTVAISDRFESSCHFHLKPLKRQDTTAEAVAQLNEDEILVRAGLIAPQDGPPPHLHPLDEQDKIVSKVEHTNSDLQTEQVRDTIAPKQKSPYHFPISSLPPQPSSSSSLSPSPPMVPSAKLTMRIRGYSFPIHFRSLNMSGLRHTTTTGGVVLAVATPPAAAAPSSASGTSTSARKHQQHVADFLR